MPIIGSGSTLAENAGKAEGITEVRRQEALLKTGALQNAILNSANFSSIATDEKGVIQIFNVGAERMLGYAAADVMNKITPADISDPQEVIARAKALSVELGTPITPGFEALVFKASRGIEDIYELTYIRKDGSRFPAVVSVTALRDARGGIIGYLLIGTDNTARKQVEAERQQLLEIQEETNKQLQQANVTLQVSEEKLAVTLNSIGDAVIATDAEGRVTLLNPLAERLTGWTQAQAAGRPVDEIFHVINQETRQPSTIPVMETLAHGTIQGLANHTILIARDGSECAIADSCAPIRDRDGQVVGAVLVFRDVTGEYAAQQALRDQQFYTRSLIESNIDAIMTTDPSGIITDVNNQMEALTGCTRDELIGTPFKNYFTDPERAEAAIKLVLGEKKVTNYELTARARDGKETVVSYNATTFYDRDGKLQGVFAAARDITERKRLDQMLQEKNAELESAKSVAEKANLAKSDFLSSMSHELRTPLNAILGFAQVMESGSPPPTPSQKRSLDQILKAGWYLLELINEILDLALIESGRLSLSREPVSLVEVMLECQAMIEPQAQKRGIGMTFPRFEMPYFVMADRTRVKQVLINLLFNAIKYNKPDGTVVVECAARPAGFDSHQRPGHRCGTVAGTAGAAFPAVQSPRPGGRRRGRHGHRPGGDQAAGRADGRHHRRRKHRRRGKRVLDRIEPDERTGACSPGSRACGAGAAAGAAWRAAAHPALCRRQSGQSGAGRAAHRAPPRPAPAQRGGRQSGHRARARLSAGGDPDGHQPARHQRHRSHEDPARGSGDGAYPDHGDQRQRDTARHREGPRGRILPLSHQTHQGQRVHGGAGRGTGIRATAAQTTEDRAAKKEQDEDYRADILNASVLIVDDQESNVSLLEEILQRGRLYPRHLDHESARGLRAASREPLRPDPARPADARHGRIPGDGRPEDESKPTATFRSS